MNHAPFIVSAYAAAAVVLAWCAIAPLVRARRFRRQWLARHSDRETTVHQARNAPRN